MWRYFTDNEFGTTINHIIFSLCNIAEKVDTERALPLLFLHALSECTTVSSFINIGKRTMWGT